MGYWNVGHWEANVGISVAKSILSVAQALADGKKQVMDEDVLALVSDQVHQPEKLWDLLGLQVLTCHPPSPVHATARPPL